MAGRQSRGRRRIPIALIQNQDDLYATFTKRRQGLFKKANEFSTLCGADVGIIVYSPTDNLFSFFTPTVESVIERYRNPDHPLMDDYMRVVETHMRARIEELNSQLDDILDEKDQVKNSENQLVEIQQTRTKAWWEEVSIESLSEEQAMEWKAYFLDFKARVQSRIRELQNGAGPSSVAPVIAPLGFSIGPNQSAIVPPGFLDVGALGNAPYGPSGGSEYQFSTLFYDAHGLPPPPLFGADGSGYPLMLPYYALPVGQDASACVSSYFALPGQDPNRHVPPYSASLGQNLGVAQHFAPTSQEYLGGDIPILPYFAPPPDQDPTGLSGQYFVPPPGQDPSSSSLPPAGHFGGSYYRYMPPPYSGDGTGRDQAGPSGTQRDDDEA